MGFDQYHEPPEQLPEATRTFAPLCASLTEEAEADPVPGRRHRRTRRGGRGGGDRGRRRAWRAAGGRRVARDRQPAGWELLDSESGEDLSIGCSDHDAGSTQLYLQESFSFQVATPEAAVALT